MNRAYKHLDSKLRIGSLSVTQWVGVTTGVAIAIVWGAYLHPLPGMLNTVTGVYIGGIPALAAWFSAEAEIDVVMRARALVRWRRGEDRYLPGAIERPRGYTVSVRARPSAVSTERESPVTLDLAELWE